ncbi:helix-turn-helix domain-containing protein [Gracilibacillus suaedae]|uniref:helix-turn-helix domain-containing protein n=1 Tax=Gracilibacillus suaedae TaxID=2820273 RepID=UPI001ABEE713|nr:helix-turn-helix transcriptional regulator [Gracilibacillus suaedae]
MLAQRLRSARRNKKLTQEELASKLHTKKQTISNYETGYSSPSNEVLKEIANILDVSTDYLLGRTDYQKEISNNKIEINEPLDGLFGYDLDSLTEEEKKELKKQLKKEVEFFLWQKKQKDE